MLAVKDTTIVTFRNLFAMRRVAAALGVIGLAASLAGCGNDSSGNGPSTTPAATVISKPANAPGNPPAPNNPGAGRPASGATGP